MKALVYIEHGANCKKLFESGTLLDSSVPSLKRLKNKQQIEDSPTHIIKKRCALRQRAC
jgi:hypothetical protein